MPKAPIDILFLSHRYDVKSGGEKALLEMIQYLVSTGLRIHVIIGDSGNITEYLDRMRVTYSVIYLPFWIHSGDDLAPFTFTSLNPTVNPTLEIVNLIKELRPRMCATNTIVIPWLAYSAAITGTPHAWMVHEVDSAFNFRYALGKKETFRTIDLLSDKIFYNSNYTAKDYTSHFRHNLDASIVHPIGNIPSPEVIISPFRKTALKLSCVGQIKPQKGQYDIIKAIKILRDRGRDVQVVLIGDPEDKIYYEKIVGYIAKHSLEENTILLGHSRNPASYVALCDISITCAKNESFGRVIVESMQLGVPVIGARSAGTLEIINTNKLGSLYTPGDVDELVTQIDLLADNPKKAREISKYAKKHAHKIYTKEYNYKAFMEYVAATPKKSSLDLSILGSVIEDFDSTRALLRHRSRELDNLRNSKSVILSSMIKKILRKSVN